MPPPTAAPTCTSRVLSTTGSHIYCLVIILSRKEWGKVQPPCGLDRCRLPGGQGGDWIELASEHSLPQEKKDKQEKGDNRDSYCMASLPGDA